jgi:hypothetical protein
MIKTPHTSRSTASRASLQTYYTHWRSHISRADVADFVVGESHKPQYLRKCPTLTAQ